MDKAGCTFLDCSPSTYTTYTNSQECFISLWIVSVLFYTLVCLWGSAKQEPMAMVAEKRTMDKLLDTMDNPLDIVLSKQRCMLCDRLLFLKCGTNRHRHSFVPHTIRLFNSCHTKVLWTLKTLTQPHTIMLVTIIITPLILWLHHTVKYNFTAS